MDISIIEYVLLFILIGFAGFVDSIAGGGGLVTIPTYISIGLPPDLILGTNKTVSTIGTTVSVWRFARGKLIMWKAIFLAIIFALMGSAGGAKLSHYLDKKSMFYLLLLIIPVILLTQKKIDLKGKATSQFVVNGFSIIKAAMIGFVIGAYDGFFGPGTGTFLLIAFVMILHMNYQQASANGRVINYISNLSAFFVFLIQGKIYWPVVMIASIAAMIGNYLGSGLVLKKADQIVAPIFRVVLVGLMIKCVFEIYQ